MDKKQKHKKQTQGWKFAHCNEVLQENSVVRQQQQQNTFIFFRFSCCAEKNKLGKADFAGGVGLLEISFAESEKMCAN